MILMYKNEIHILERKNRDILVSFQNIIGAKGSDWRDPPAAIRNSGQLRWSIRTITTLIPSAQSRRGIWIGNVGRVK
jgi:hypothetical protein